jgi:hypothetical protein
LKAAKRRFQEKKLCDGRKKTHNRWQKFKSERKSQTFKLLRSSQKSSLSLIKLACQHTLLN